MILARALCLLAFATPAVAAPQFAVTEGSLTPAEATASQALLADAVRRLPDVWLDALPQRLEVEWRDDLPTAVHGRAEYRRMLLDRRLLGGWMARTPDPADPAARAALAAVIHELAHFYDRTPEARLSSDPRFLDLAGWQVSPMRFGLRTSKNAFSDRTPDPYELKDAAEFVAVNLEHFLLDGDYACRRPALAAYFATRFGREPPPAECAPGFAILQADAVDEAPPLLELDPERVYAVEYLLAEANSKPLSRWGHSMLRLVVCAPGRAPGPDCRLDLAYHRVLSFRAFVGDVQISSWRGLTGSYPSRLYVLPLAQVIDEYTKVELRGLQSIPLRLAPDEVAALLERMARLHWSYDGRYYFISNNCAVETFKLLHDGVPRLAGYDLSSITPTGLLKNLERAGVADESVLGDRAEALRLGYYFEASNTHDQAMYDVARQALTLPPPRVEDWLDLRPGERAPWLGRGDLRSSAALLLLEEAAMRRQELLARDELKHRFFRPDAHAALQGILALEGLLARPAALLPGGGYGLPQAAEREALTREGGRQAAAWRQQSAGLRAEARQWLSPERRATLEATEANVAALGGRLRRLHEEQGGLQLTPPSSP